MIFAMLANPLWTGFGDAYFRNDFNWIDKTIKKLRVICVIISFGLILLLIFQSFVYKIWVGDILEVDYYLSISMVIYMILNMWNTLHNPLLNATSKLKLQIILSFIIPPLYLILAVIFIKWMAFGTKGIMFAIIIAQALPLAFLYPIHVKKIITNKATGIWG